MTFVYKKDLQKLGILSKDYTLNGLYKINNNKYLYSINCYLIFLSKHDLDLITNYNYSPFDRIDSKYIILPFQFRKYHEIYDISYYINNINYMVISDILENIKNKQFNIKMKQNISNKKELPYILSKFDLKPLINTLSNIIDDYKSDKIKLLDKKCIYKFIKKNIKNKQLINYIFNLFQ